MTRESVHCVKSLRVVTTFDGRRRLVTVHVRYNLDDAHDNGGSQASRARVLAILGTVDCPDPTEHTLIQRLWAARARSALIRRHVRQVLFRPERNRLPAPRLRLRERVGSRAGRVSRVQSDVPATLT
jgi:hypothetical protein